MEFNLWKLPKTWSWKTMKDISEIKAGSTPSTSNSEYWNGDINWVTPDDLSKLTGKYISKGKRSITEQGLQNSSTQLLPKGTIVFSSRAPIGYVAIASEGLCTNQGCKNFILNKTIYQDYVYYYLQIGKEFAEKLGSGTTFKEISAQKAKQIPIPLPSTLDEQKAIVSEIEKQLTRLSESVKSLQRVKEKLEIYRKAVLKKAFEKKEGWAEKKISDLFYINPSKSEIKDLNDNVEVSFIPMAYVSEKGKIDKIDKKLLKEVKKGFTFFKNNDVLLAKITPCFENGKKAIAENLANGIGFGTTEFYVFRERGEVIPKWIYYNLSRDDFRSGAKRSMGGAVGQQRVSKDFIEKFNLAFPQSKEEQTQIVQEIEDKFSVIDKIEQVVNSSLDKTEKLRKSILKSAFEGKLVQGVNK